MTTKEFKNRDDWYNKIIHDVYPYKCKRKGDCLHVLIGDHYTLELHMAKELEDRLAYVQVFLDNKSLYEVSWRHLPNMNPKFINRCVFQYDTRGVAILANLIDELQPEDDETVMEAIKTADKVYRDEIFGKHILRKFKF